MTGCRLAFVICAGLVLGGCAETAADSSNPSPAPQTTRLSGGTITPQNEISLYLDVINNLIKQKRYSAALAFLDGYAVKEKNFQARYWLLRGDALLGLDRHDEASAAYAKLEDTPLAPAGWNGKGRVSAAQSQWRAAATNFQRAVQGEPSNPDFLNNLAFAEMHVGHGGASAAYLRQAYELKPDSDLIRNNLIIALTLAGDRNGADAILLGVKDAAQREEVKTIVDSVIKDNNLTMDGKS